MKVLLLKEPKENENGPDPYVKVSNLRMELCIVV